MAEKFSCPNCGQPQSSQQSYQPEGNEFRESWQNASSHSSILRFIAIVMGFVCFGALLAGLIIVIAPKDSANQTSAIGLMLAVVLFGLACATGVGIGLLVQVHAKNTSVPNDSICSYCGYSLTNHTIALPRPIIPNQGLHTPTFITSAPPPVMESVSESANNMPQVNPPRPSKTSLQPPVLFVRMSPDSIPEAGRLIEPTVKTTKPEPSLYVAPPSILPIPDSAIKRLPKTDARLEPNPIAPHVPKTKKTVQPQNENKGNAKNSTPTEKGKKCPHGKRWGHCALCDMDSYKRIYGSWESD